VENRVIHEDISHNFFTLWLLAFGTAIHARGLIVVARSVRGPIDECFHLLIKATKGPDQTPEKIEEFRKVHSQPVYLKRSKFGTNIYYLASTEHSPRAGEIPTSTKSIVIALGGSGSAGGNGSAFMRNATSLRGYGISMIAMDYPFDLPPLIEKKNMKSNFQKEYYPIKDQIINSR